MTLGVRIIYDYGFDDERLERGELLTSNGGESVELRICLASCDSLSFFCIN